MKEVRKNLQSTRHKSTPDQGNLSPDFYIWGKNKPLTTLLSSL